MNHGVLERLEEVLLELETGQFFFLQKTHGELPQRVQGEIADMSIAVAADLGFHQHLQRDQFVVILTWLKCSPRIVQTFTHSKRIRFML